MVLPENAQLCIGRRLPENLVPAKAENSPGREHRRLVEDSRGLYYARVPQCIVEYPLPALHAYAPPAGVHHIDAVKQLIARLRLSHQYQPHQGYTQV